MIDELARRGLKNHASRLDKAEALIRIHIQRIQALEGSYDTSGEHTCDPDSRCRRAAWDCRG